MKYCKNCNVNVHKELDNCPICGSYVNDNHPKVVYEHYPEMEDAVGYPKITTKVDAKSTARKLNCFILLTCLLCVGINLLVNPKILWFVWVCLAGVIGITCIVPHVFLKKNIYVQLPTYAVASCLTMLLIDFFDGHFHPFTGWSLEYVIPFILLSCLVTLDFLIIFKGKREKSFLMAMYFSCLLALVPQIVMWCINNEQYSYWATLSVFFASIANALTITIILYPTVKEEFGKKFNI